MFVSLSGQWRLSDGSHFITGNVPGDVTNDVYLAGLIRDPYFGDNWKDCLWVTRCDWTYEREFFVETLPSVGERVYLRFEGVDTYADVYLNGEKLGSTESMQRAYEFFTGGALKQGNNTLTVKLRNVFEKIGEEDQTKYGSIFHANRIFARKAQCHFGWDWAPQFPGYGIFRDVFLISEPVCAVREVNIRPYVSGDVTFRLRFDEKFSGDLQIIISKDGKEAARYSRAVNAKKLICNLRVDDPALWWPNGYGEAALYDYEIVQYAGGKVLCSKKGTFGFREVALEKSVLDGENLAFRFKINGREVFFRGSNWVPAECMTGRLTDEKYHALVKAAKDANMNMLRVWGGGIYESDRFYEYCDRMGIMLWHDFMFACSEIPEDDPAFMKKLAEETAMQVKRLKNHPCLAYWCGMNEVTGSFCDEDEKYSFPTLHYLFRGIVGEYSEEIPYGYASPYAFADTENDAAEGDVHANISEPCLFNASFKGFEKFEYDGLCSAEETQRRICHYDDYLGDTDGNFTSECAVLGACCYRSLVKYAPESELRLDAPFFEQRFLGNPYTYIMPTFYERQTLIASSMYGSLSSVKDFVKKVNKSQADIMTSEIAYARSGARSGGLLTWMYNDIWPTGTWSVVDYYLAKKPAYYAMKRCFAPFMAEIIRIKGDYYLCLANDTAKPFASSFEIALCDYAGNVLQTESGNYALEAGGRSQIKLSFCGERAGYLKFRYERDGAPCGGVFWVGRYRKEPLDCRYAVAMRREKDGVAVTVKAQTFVPCFTVFAGESAEISENCLDLPAGEEKEIFVRGAAAEEIIYASFCEEWDR